MINIQDAFLNYVRKNKVPVTIFLLNGVKITGTVSCFDQNSIVIRREGYMQLVYKTAISTFSPHGAVNIFDWNTTQPNNTYARKERVDNDDEEIVIEIEEESAQEE